MSVSTSSEISNFKPQYGWSVVALHPVTPPLARLFVRAGLSANAVSIASLLVFLPGLALYAIAHDSLIARIIVVVLFIISTLLDVVDGYVARLSGTAGKFGAYLDAGIDLFRYNVFFLTLFLLKVEASFEIAVLLLYVTLLNVSFMRLFIGIRVGRREQSVNKSLERVLPKSYRDFCLQYKLLYNPLNLEDQLLFLIFIVGVLLQIEMQMLMIGLAVRLMELGVVLGGRVTTHVAR
jgi:phosphatidylglycerophosphate synthase